MMNSEKDHSIGSDLSENKPPKSFYLLPNLITTGGLFAGFYAVIVASQGRFVAACVAVFVAGLLDGMDGRIARLTNTQSEFGVQYDSLADLVSFGVAPAMVMYFWGLDEWRAWGEVAGKVGWTAAFLYTACAALRLARFNTQVEVVDKSWFMGLASPAAAGLLVSAVWFFENHQLSAASLRVPTLLLTLLAAGLMVSEFRFYSFKKVPWIQRVPFVAVLLLLGLLAALMISPPHVLFGFFLLYALSAPCVWLWRMLGGRQADAHDDEAEDS